MSDSSTTVTDSILKRTRILAVDDEPLIIQFVKANLDQAGYEGDTATNASIHNNLNRPA